MDSRENMMPAVETIAPEAPSSYQLAPRNDSSTLLIGPPGFSPPSGGIPSSLIKKKRGRPRNYGPDGVVAGGGESGRTLSPIPISASAPPASATYSDIKFGEGEGSGGGYLGEKKKKGKMNSSETKPKHAYGSTNLGDKISSGGSFTPHMVTVNPREVFLREWWLIEVERDSKLGIGGFVNRETLASRGMRLLRYPSVGKRYNLDAPENDFQPFASVAIAKRLDSNTLEAVDGIIITISGCINRSRTRSYGFSVEVCDRFLSGFPCDWEGYAAKSSRDKCANTTERSLPTTFGDLPVTRVRDLLLSTNGESEACAFTSIILRDILKQCSGDSLNQSAYLVDPVTKTEVEHKQHDGDFLLNPTQKIVEDAHKIHAFPADLHDKEIESCKETEDDYKKGNGGSVLNAKKISEESQGDTRNLAVSNQKIQVEECNATTVSGNREIMKRRYPPRRSTRAENRQPKRSKRD